MERRNLVVLSLIISTLIITSNVVSNPSGLNNPSDSAFELSDSISTQWNHDCSNTTGFIYSDQWTLWQSAAEGTIQSDGSQIEITNIGSGAEWHGPVFEYELASPFPVKNLKNFKVNFSADNSLSSYVGSGSVVLGDANRNPILLIHIHDAWVDYSKGFYGVRYHFANGTQIMWGSGYPVTWTGFEGLMSLRFDPFSGIVGSVEGIGEHTLIPLDDVELDREIFYVGIGMARYESRTLLPCYFDNIYLEHENLNVNLWYDDCSSTEGWINQGNESGFTGTYFSEDISLTSESGYIFAESLPLVEDYYSGATFVKELDTPIPITNILLFEVEFEWIYEPDCLGFFRVFLFDDNKTISAYIRARDSWAANLMRPECRYYPLDGDVSILYQDETDSWRGFVRFWYDSSSESLQGEIYDGSSNSATLKESGYFDSNRIIKYIGLSPSRRNDYPYNDENLRIHSIKMEYLLKATNLTTETTIQTSITTESSLSTITNPSPTSSSSISNTITDNGTTSIQLSNIILIISYTVTIGSGIVIIIFIVLIIRNKKP